VDQVKRQKRREVIEKESVQSAQNYSRSDKSFLCEFLWSSHPDLCIARRFLLLGQGDFVESLMDAVQEERNGELRKLEMCRIKHVRDLCTVPGCKIETLTTLAITS